MAKKIITSEKAKELHKGLKSCWSEETKLSQKILIACLQNLEEINGNKKKHKLSVWQRFASEYLKQGKTMQEASNAWREKNDNNIK